MKIFFVILPAIIMSTIMSSKSVYRVTPQGDQDPDPLFSFGIIADVQYCDCDPAGTRYFRSSLPKLEEAMRFFRKESPGFIINLGDLIEKDFDSYNAVMNILDSSGLKIYHVAGNHDYSVESKYKKHIPPLEAGKEGYYTFRIDRYRFIILNGNEISTYSSGNNRVIKQAAELIDKLKAGGEINALDWNGAISAKQIKWLTNQLNRASSNDELVFIACHFPVWPVNEHNLLNYKDIIDLLGKYNNIIAWFNGHNHMGNYGNFNMIHFITLKGMVETPAINSYSVVDVYKNKIWIRGSGREKSQILAY
jgi:manganese-dependent ADP-ribose/CDP-alcohol diphosphatase